ncbi:hypothetical protein GQ43DRAFT_251376 [Delitschia confertaspora ATCC 74209]|uniref:Xylanolytic transcriptional activator regulatory domain-containing protein n=1 Tax=Delitschia confertaspora ATCC 74209 TaxID=1513339 RepID=A0A9P4N1B2_9PLEO|nr:hypothetical protein GQ43DRAFT_251376 [Delitschia confertaspora ATCC 74209]
MSPPTKLIDKDNEAGLLVADEDGKSIYLENYMWTKLRPEFRDTGEILDESSDDEAIKVTKGTSTTPAWCGTDGIHILFGSSKPAAALRHLHPSPLQIFKLWQIYLDNINPLVKVFHTPTVQQLILHASGTLDDIPRNLEALMFAMYCVALSSVCDHECPAILGESKSGLMRRFRTGVQQALVNAGLLKSTDIRVLQAFTLYILSLQNVDARTTWIFTGIAGRLGQRIGLHRDGEALGLPPFEVEMRRRLWWQIIMMEGVSEKLVGTSSNTLMGDAKMPSNLNDSDLFPGMKEMPKEHEGATEMMFFLIRCNVGQFLKHTLPPKTGFDGYWNKLSGNAVSIATKDKAIDDLGALLERKFLQYCDHSIPWHFMCIYLCKSVICMMRFIARSKDYCSEPTLTNQAERDMLFSNSLQVTQYENMAYTMKHLHGFQWHINMHFQWKAFINLISELRYRTGPPQAEEAWKAVQQVYECHPTFAKEGSKRALPIAIGNLTLKAWNAYTLARGLPPDGEPHFIHILRAQRQKREQTAGASSVAAQLTPRTLSAGSVVDATSAWLSDPLQGLHQEPLVPLPVDDWQWNQWNADISASLDMNQLPLPNMPPIALDSDQLNWSAWENLVIDYETQAPNQGYPVDSAFPYGGQ